MTDEIEDLKRQLEEIGWARIKGHIASDKLDSAESDAERRFESANTRYESRGSDRKVELEATRSYLKGARDWRSVAEHRRKLNLPMDTFSLHPDTAESEALHDFRLVGGPLDFNKSGPQSQVLRNVLDQLHAETFLFLDHLDVRGKVDMTVPFIESDIGEDQRQVSQAPRGSG